MGMDLKPINPSAKAPTDEGGAYIWGRYNWHGWSRLCELLDEWGVDTHELSGSNDGAVISDVTCKEIASAIEDNLSTLTPEEQRWLKEDIVLWRTCGGYKQW